jgi:CHAT domain-containing protein
LRKPPKVCIGEAASENAVDSGLTNDGVDVLHLACHGVFDLADAMSSGVLLAPDGARDSLDQRLTARDLLRLRMRTELVTLSACESGLSEQRPGEELVGLTRALIYAGAPSVVVSLWSVDEISTSMLMEAFYRSLLAGASKALALQEAQTSLRRASLRDVITHCEAAMGNPDLAGMPEVVATLDRDVADARYRAGDFAAALTSYSRLLEQVPVSSPTHAVLLAAAARCRAAMRGSDAIAADYDRRPFEHPYYWAPFVLVGDWR